VATTTLFSLAAVKGDSKEAMMPAPVRWVRALGVALGVTVSILSAAGGIAQAVDYNFVSIDSGAGSLAQFTRSVPTVNSVGTTAFAEVVYNPSANRDEYVVFRHDGAQLTPVLNLTDALGVGHPSSLVMNDAGAIAVHYSRGNEAVVVRIAVDGSFTVLARADLLGSAPYRELAPTISMNRAGQVAALVTNPDLTSSIVRLDDRDPAPLEIARSSAALLDFGTPTINDSGTVAFRARVPAPGDLGVYSGSGGPLTNEGIVAPCPGASGYAPVIDNDGFVLGDCGTPLLFRAHGGIVNVLVAGSEDPMFGRVASSYSVNTRGRPAFVAGPAGGSTEVGLFTGSDAGRDKVVRTGDVVFGLAVQDIRMGHRSINDAGQIAFVVQVGGAGASTSHVVLATPRRIPQTISFQDVAGLSYGHPPFGVTATASSGLPVTFAASGACSVAGGTVTLLGAGSCTLTASQAGDATYLPAEDVVKMLSIGRASQTITFAALADRTFGDPAVIVAASASSGLPVTFSAAGACSVAGSLVTLAAAGACTIVASQAGNADYEPAANVSRVLAVARAGQTIAFATLPDRTFGDLPFAVSAAASSGLPVSLTASGNCTIAAGVLTLGGGGSCTATASQAGNADYEPAADVARAFGVARAAQTITFAPPPGRTFGDPPFTVTATASSGLPVSFSGTGNCVLAGDVLTITGAGSCAVRAAQGGDANYLPASDVTQAVAIARAAQTITFGPLPSRRLADPPFAVSATASSTLPVTFTARGACSVGATMVSVTGAGVCTVTTSQAGNADFDPAPSVARSFQISGVILEAHFDAGTNGFDYVDDPFRGSQQAAYASGVWLPSGGFRGGALSVNLGGIDNNTIAGMSGGWRTTFSLSAPTKVTLYVRGNLTQSPYYEPDEKSELLVGVDGVLVGAAPNDFLAQIVGDGNTGGSISTGWRLYSVSLGTLSAGAHTLVIGGYNSKKTEVGESTTVLIDDVLLTEAGSGARAAVASLDIERFKDNIRILASYGDRTQGSVSYMNAAAWLQNQLQAAGYTLQQHPYTYLGQSRTSMYVTKVGTLTPDQMYIVSAHLDGRGGGGAANDDASGCSLVLEVARALAGLQTAVSVRFIFWNNEETGLNGSTAYRNDRASQQGVENPPGSGLYPEPRWLGIIQHDQILWDHGLPSQPNQIPGADLDVEYQASSTYATQSLQLANALRAGNQAYSTTYPAQIGSNMNYTDSVPFQNYTAAVSVRDNQRVAEIGNGSNPTWHQPTDVYATYSEADFSLGFNAVQMTLGTVAELVGATMP